jgi:hypothetical protein
MPALLTRIWSGDLRASHAATNARTDAKDSRSSSITWPMKQHRNPMIYPIDRSAINPYPSTRSEIRSALDSFRPLLIPPSLTSTFKGFCACWLHSRTRPRAASTLRHARITRAPASASCLPAAQLSDCSDTFNY